MQDEPIFQASLPFLPWMDPRTARLPGILPVEGEDWLRVDEAFAGQMALRDRLIAGREAAVIAMLEEARPAAEELLDRVLARLQGVAGYRLGERAVLRPDGVEVALDRDAPLRTLGRLVQEDLCLLQAAPEKEHRLTGAALCFPASWTLAQKLGRPMTGIHEPVVPYDAEVARRVQRLFDAIRPEQPLWRMNFLTYDDWALHQPRLEGQRRPRPTAHVYVRSERQCLIRLARTRAVVFAIHTYVVRAETLPEDARAALMARAH